MGYIPPPPPPPPPPLWLDCSMEPRYLKCQVCNGAGVIKKDIYGQSVERPCMICKGRGATEIIKTRQVSQWLGPK